jgi:4-amino-4-deoxy-L-arabinose transferase-like glycosyltransferase
MDYKALIASSKIHTLTGSGLLLCMAFLLLSSLPSHSVTIDEFAHLPAGYYYYQTGDFSLFHKNPPAIKLIMALPLLILQPSIDTQMPFEPLDGWHPWKFGQNFMERNRSAYQQIFFWGRVPIVFLTLLMGFFIWRWATEIYGRSAGLGALWIYCFSPTILANAQLATIDIGCALGFLLAYYYFYQFLAQRSWQAALKSGVALGFALLTKFTTILLLPLLAVMTLVYVFFFYKRLQIYDLKKIVGGGLLILGSALLILNLGYGFQGSFKLLGGYHFQSSFLKQVSQILPGYTPVPFPEPYILGFDLLRVDTEYGEFPNYLFGTWSKTGWIYYFPMTMLLKMPLILILLLLAAPFKRAFRNISKEETPQVKWQQELLIGLPAAILLLLFCLLIKTNYGIRYILPVLPFLFILLGRLFQIIPIMHRTWRLITLLLLLLYPFSALSIHPHYISYFNFLGGDNFSKHKLLLDSNLDWGQDLVALKDFMKKHDIARIGLAYFGHADPTIYGIDWDIPESQISPYVAVSANFAHGYPYVIYRNGQMQSPPKDAYLWASQIEPDFTINGSILIFHFKNFPDELRHEKHYEKAHDAYLANNIYDSVIHYQRAIWANPVVPVYHLELGIALIKLGHIYQAIAELHRAQALDPQNQDGIYLRASELLAFYLHKTNHLQLGPLNQTNR